MDGVPYDFTERQVYEVGQQVAAALVSLLMLAAFFPSCLIATQVCTVAKVFLA